ncbi:hypothetical protein PFICI_06588 [Pestalotiopsis fici W106-1]|uniref:F-box domain-containing protein n=1 Tax=Pestalotiopsis fici (strain W106-1 / CGMCC3.15140) TaxID=1229662 RepID=W3X8S7_PESFW|nr:uncharacterized protein PFICI_06588 [Pestalotiopsis fici W106-1]ETS81586.1 hypothetical protein PFICI_06588 [Pestalotiopsis fici W106-1]
MARLSDLPAELFDAILEHLYIVDLWTLLLSQSTSRRFRRVVQLILSRSNLPYTEQVTDEDEDDDDDDGSSYWCSYDINVMLWRNFNYIFRPTSCFTVEEIEQQNNYYLTIVGNRALSFQRLRWVKEDHSRQAYLRPEASWRHLTIARPCQKKPFTRLEIIRSYTSDEHGDEVEYLRLDLLDQGILTMGLLYDTLLSDMVHFGNNTGGWVLHRGVRLRNYDLLLEYECFVINDDELLDLGPDSQQCAILHIEGAAVEADTEVESWTVNHDWTPSMIEPDRIRFLNWDGEHVSESTIKTHLQ